MDAEPDDVDVENDGDVDEGPKVKDEKMDGRRGTDDRACFFWSKVVEVCAELLADAVGLSAIINDGLYNR